MYKKYYASALLCLLIIITGAFAHAQNVEKKEEKNFHWRVLSIYAPRLSIYQNGLEKFANDIKLLSNDQVDIKIYVADQEYQTVDGENKRVKASDVFNDVSKGKAEMGFGSTSVFTGDNIPACNFWYAVPFGMNAKDMYAWLNKGDGLELWREMYMDLNVIPFPVGDTGGAMGGWFKNKIEKISDFKYMNIRMNGLHSKVMQKLGATEKWIPSMEALNAYNKGEIDAIVCLGPYADLGYKFFQGPKYYYYPGWQEPGGVISLIINKNFWNELPENLQRTIEIVCNNTYQYISTQFDTMNSIALKELVEKEGVQLMEFPPEVLDIFRRLSTEVLEEEAKKTPQFAKIYRSFKKFKEENVESGWGKIVNMAVSPGYSNAAVSKFIEGLADSKVAKVTSKGNNSVVITFNGAISFGSWASDLNNALSNEIANIVKIIRDNSISIKWINVEGHSATDGGECQNWLVSKERANAVAKLLIDNGIEKSLIKVVAYGESYPIIYPDDTEEKRSINRRVEIVIEF